MKKNILQKKTILVVEDERALLNVVKEKFDASGFSVITARSVDQVFSVEFEKSFKEINAKTISEALAHLESLKKIDAIWLDHNLLGKENGLDLVKKIKANGGRWKKIPIFVISNTDKEKTIASYTSLGVRKYYIKSNHRLDEIIADIRLSLDTKKSSFSFYFLQSSEVSYGTML